MKRKFIAKRCLYVDPKVVMNLLLTGRSRTEERNFLFDAKMIRCELITVESGVSLIILKRHYVNTNNVLFFSGIDNHNGPISPHFCGLVTTLRHITLGRIPLD